MNRRLAIPITIADFLGLGLLRVFLTIIGLVFYLKKQILNWGLAIMAVNFISWSYSLVKFLAFADHSNLHQTYGPYMAIAWNFIAWLSFSALWTLGLHCEKLPDLIVRVQSFVHHILPSFMSRTVETDTEQLIDETNEKEIPKNRLSTYETALRLIIYCKHHFVWFTLGFIFLTIYSAARIFIPLYTGNLIANIVNGKGFPALIQSVLIMGGLSLLASFFGGLRGGSFDWATALVHKRMRDDLFRSLVKQEIAFYDESQTGEIASRLTSDCEKMSTIVSTNLNVFMRSLMMLIGALIFMFYMSWRLTLVTFILIPVVGFITKVYGAYYDNLSERDQNTIADANRKAEEVLSTMRTVRSFACEKNEADKFEFHLLETLNVRKSKAFAYMGYTWLNELCENAILVCVLGFGGYLCISKAMTTDHLITFLLYQMQLGENLYNIGWVFTSLMEAVGASRKVFDYILRKPNIRNDGSDVEQVKGEIEFKNVTFNYPSRPTQTVLNDISFKIESGSKIALVGHSGAGKSSIISLIERFYLPDKGEILLDGKNINSFDHEYFHQNIGLVAQNPVLYSGTVRENILYGCNWAGEKEMIEAAKLANCHDFVMATESGYMTMCGERGVKFSGGEIQRICIARILVRGCKIILLDESTSALDSQSEALVQEALDKCSINQTVIKIAHRLSTVEKSDAIFVVDQGSIKQVGTHTHLMADKNGLYYNLVQRQLLSHKENIENLTTLSPFGITQRPSIPTSSNLIHRGSPPKLLSTP
uniref:ATP-binding cassette sub-family B member 9 n=1 Tax=Rhabditophanes sp. KR3021 TaxID=114890 RepID=A0AC35U5V0_9BILA